jgi:hypothetical protein
VQTIKSHVEEQKRVIKSNYLLITFLIIMISVGKKSGLQIDQEGRKASWKKFFGVPRYRDARLNHCILSDSALSDRLKELNGTKLRGLNYEVLKKGQDRGIISRIGVLDGSHACGQYGSYLGFKTSYGDIFLVDYEPNGGMGRELSSSKRLIERMEENLGESRVELLLLDMLYMNEGILNMVREGYVRNILIKYTPDRKEDGSPKLYRTLLKEFEKYLELQDKPKRTKVENLKVEGSGYQYEKGYDKYLGVNYTVRSIKRLDIDGNYKIAKVIEENPVNGKSNLFYVFTTDKEMSGNQMRKHGHGRWIIENDGFKMMNELLWSKHKWFKEQKTSENLILIWLLSFSLLWLFRRISETYLKKLFPGMKITTKFVSDFLNIRNNENIVFDSA